MSAHAVWDWPAIRARLTGLYQCELSNAGGTIPYDALGMFRLMLLGQWHGLSDNPLEQTLRVGIDLMVFTGFKPSAAELPDASMASYTVLTRTAPSRSFTWMQSRWTMG